MTEACLRAHRQLGVEPHAQTTDNGHWPDEALDGVELWMVPFCDGSWRSCDAEPNRRQHVLPIIVLNPGNMNIEAESNQCYRQHLFALVVAQFTSTRRNIFPHLA